MNFAALPEILLKLSMAALESVLMVNPLPFVKQAIESGSELITEVAKELMARKEAADRLRIALLEAEVNFNQRWQELYPGSQMQLTLVSHQDSAAIQKAVEELPANYNQLNSFSAAIALLTKAGFPQPLAQQAAKLWVECLERALVPLQGYALPILYEKVNGVKMDTEEILATLRQFREEMLVRVHPTASGPAPTPRFLVPFPRNLKFVGREDDLTRLHEALQNRQTLGVLPAALTGMGGIGKTQLAVEYAYRFQDSYPGGVYWINAANNWRTEFADRAIEINITNNNASESQREIQLALAFFDFLNHHSDALVIFDNVEDPRQLNHGKYGFIPSRLKCRLLFTTRRRDLNFPFQSIEVCVLPEEVAVELLLNTEARKGVLLAGGKELEEAHIICRLLGCLPLALVLASALLVKKKNISLKHYRKILEKEGLAAIDSSGLDALDLPTRHDAAVGITLKSQWEALENEDARLALQTAAILGEAVQIPQARLALLSGLPLETEDLHVCILPDALAELQEYSLVEELSDCDVRLHPLVTKFVIRGLPNQAVFEEACSQRLIQVYLDVIRLNKEVALRGIDAVLGDLRIAKDLSHEENLRQQIDQLLRPLDLEAHHLRGWVTDSEPGFFLQQFCNRCLNLELKDWQMKSEDALSLMRLPYILERIQTMRESTAILRTLEGHTDGVNSVALSSDGRVAVSASADSTIKVWDLASGQCLHTLRGHTSGVNSIALSSDGRLAVSASDDFTLMVWDLENGQCLRTLVGELAFDCDIFKLENREIDKILRHLNRSGNHSGVVFSVAVNSDGRVAVSASDDETLKVWDIESGQCLRTLEGHTGGVKSVVLSRDGRVAVSASIDETLKVWDIESGQCLRTLKGHKIWVNSVVLNSDGRVAVSASTDGTLKVWDLESGQCLRTLEGHTQSVRSVSISNDGRVAVSASDDETLKVWDLESGQCLRTLKGHTQSVRSVSISNDGRVAVSASYDRTLKVWDLESDQCLHTQEGHTGGVKSVALSSDERVAVSASDDGTLKVWDLESGQCLRTLEGHTGGVKSVVLKSDGRVAVSASIDETLKVWDLESGQCVRTLKGYNIWVNSVVLRSDGWVAVSASIDETLKVWDLESGQNLHTLEGHTDLVKSIILRSDGRVAVSASYNGTLKVWDLASGQCLHTLEGHTDVVNSVVLSRDGRDAVSASYDGTLKVWDLESGQCLRTLKAHTGGAWCVVLSSDGRVAVSASVDGNLKVWDLESGQCIHTLKGHSDLVTCVALRSDGRVAFSASSDKTFRVWNIKKGFCLHTLEGNAPFTCIVISQDCRAIIAGDLAGAVHFVKWVRPELAL